MPGRKECLSSPNPLPSFHYIRIHLTKKFCHIFSCSLFFQKQPEVGKLSFLYCYHGEKKSPWTSLFRLFMLSISQKHGTGYVNLPDLKHRAHTQYSEARTSITLCWCSGSAPSLKNNTICNIYMLLLCSDPKWSWTTEVKCKQWVIL